MRSQNKNVLTTCNYFDVNDEGEIIIYDGCPIAKYKTKERALEVLDEIQERIINLQLVSLEERGKARQDVYTRSYLECVYQMPKE